ncbi:keratin, type II cytoskeletal 1-like [Scylla paramamosain]|uniref:keratin, type II cytoskeletal 1-like n=1 Tax=Scylla paramamosain TaxID=85552 RepID=UPI0030839184
MWPARLSGEPGVAEVEDLHQELQKKLQEVLPCLAEALREQAEVMKRVEALRRHCHQNKTAVDFCPGEEVKEGEEENKGEDNSEGRQTENKIDLDKLSGRGRGRCGGGGQGRGGDGSGSGGGGKKM